MDTSPDLASTVLWELRLIRWLLILLFLVAIGFLIGWITFARAAGGLGEIVKKQHQEKEIENELESLLSQGSAQAAKFAATEWLARRPKHPHCHWYLAKAHFQLGEFVEAKRVFQTLMKISPDWEAAVTPWIERTDREIQAGPRIVK
jgi:hypothetical protein